MVQVTLGRTGIAVNKNGFGALPIQRVSRDEAAYLLQKALDNGIDFFDTARAYTDSEEKIGFALGGRRSEYILATKTAAQGADGFWNDLHTSLKNLKTDCVDILQFHNPAFCPRPGDGTGLYEAALEAREQGKLRFIGITNHRLAVAQEAAVSGLYDTLQFPFSYLAAEEEIRLAQDCKALDIGFIAMKALSGGLITNAAAAYAFQARYDNVLPIWGVQRERELDEFLSFLEEPPEMTPELQAAIDHDRGELAGEFCRGCGYCLPCPAQIDIPTCARMSLLLRRSPAQGHLSPEGQAKMERIDHCVHCNQCTGRCPYGLDTPELLRRNYEDYKTFLEKAGG
ncbi:MAG: aldo/keto reductase [Clostridiales bacterium]|nr:aldo/keto reductase [Clostridiales bacterium]